MFLCQFCHSTFSWQSSEVAQGYMLVLVFTSIIQIVDETYCLMSYHT